MIKKSPLAPYPSIDIAKMLMSLIIIGIHIHPFNGDAYYYTWGMFSRLAVPFFFITSAFLFFRKQPSKQDLKHFLRRIGKLYAFWFIIMLPQTIVQRFSLPLDNLGNQLSLFVLDTLFGIGGGFAGGWFLIALMESICIVWYASQRISIKTITAIGGGIYLFLSLTTSYDSFMPEFIDKTMNEIPLDLCGSFLSALVFIALGKWVADNSQRIEHLKPSLLWGGFTIMAVAMFVWIKFIDNTLHPEDNRITMIQVICTLLLLLALLRTTVSFKLPYTAIRKASIIFYLSHFSFDYTFIFFKYHLIYWNLSPLTQYVTAVIGCTLIFLLITKLSTKKKFKWLKYAY